MKNKSTRSGKSKNRFTSKRKAPFILFSVIILISVAYVLIDSSNPNSPTPPSTTLKPQTKKPPKPLPTSDQTYNFSHGDSVQGPKPTQATISPIDPQMTDLQTLSVKIKHESPVKSATITLITDTKETSHQLSLVDGSDTEGTWQAKWKVDDTYEYSYQIDFNFSDNDSSFSGGLAFR